ncbi:hypothetical protein BXZ70DRAFT_206551 [Cristinia sonorae]|uniref:Uncharacterized protein n=1 Tax=Cristinia sonorae TaxID=1940300 RepID=A0A8K0UNG0_9AGAR|nr:hypothetical protein BXZ70DRAFT_206551 [Cristinia sonorae]
MPAHPLHMAWRPGPILLVSRPWYQTSAPALKQFPPQTGTSFTWLVNLPANTIFTIVLKDQTGATVFSDVETITAGADDKCLNPSVQDDGKGGTEIPTGTTTSNTSKTAGPTTTPPPGNQQQTGDAVKTAGSFGVAALVGIVGAALL